MEGISLVSTCYCHKGARHTSCCSCSASFPKYTHPKQGDSSPLRCCAASIASAAASWGVPLPLRGVRCDCRSDSAKPQLVPSNVGMASGAPAGEGAAECVMAPATDGAGCKVASGHPSVAPGGNECKTWLGLERSRTLSLLQDLLRLDKMECRLCLLLLRRSCSWLLLLRCLLLLRLLLLRLLLLRLLLLLRCLLLLLLRLLLLRLLLLLRRLLLGGDSGERARCRPCLPAGPFALASVAVMRGMWTALGPGDVAHPSSVAAGAATGASNGSAGLPCCMPCCRAGTVPKSAAPVQCC